MAKRYICTGCGYLGKPVKVKVKKGNVLLEVILWLLLIVPGFIYSIWRYTSSVDMCPKCKKGYMVPVEKKKIIKTNM